VHLPSQINGKAKWHFQSRGRTLLLLEEIIIIIMMMMMKGYAAIPHLKRRKRGNASFPSGREKKNGEMGDFSFPPHKNCHPRRSNGPIFDPSSET
jgi:hypothetical protein